MTMATFWTGRRGLAGLLAVAGGCVRRGLGPRFVLHGLRRSMCSMVGYVGKVIARTVEVPLPVGGLRVVSGPPWLW